MATKKKLKPLTVNQYEMLKKLVGRRIKGNALILRQTLLRKCRRLGTGSGRIAYLIEVKGFEPFVFKFRRVGNAWCKELNGDCQNKTEIRIYQRSTHKDHYVPRFYDWDNVTWRWVEMEYLSPLPRTAWSGCKLMPTYKAMRKLARKFRLGIGDVTRSDHWGLDDKSRVRILDMGFDIECVKAVNALLSPW